MIKTTMTHAKTCARNSVIASLKTTHRITAITIPIIRNMASGTLRTAWNSGSRWIAAGRPDRSGKGEDIMADRADNGIRKQDNYGTADCANIIAPDGEYEQMTRRRDLGYGPGCMEAMGRLRCPALSISPSIPMGRTPVNCCYITEWRTVRMP